MLDIATLPGDSYDERLQKQLQVGMAVASVGVIAAWGLLFALQGHMLLAFYPWAYCATTLVMIGVLALTRRWSLFRLPHIVLVETAPFILHWQLGGFRGSGGAILWCLIGPVAAMLLAGPTRSIPFFLGLVTLCLLGWLRDGPLLPTHFELTSSEMSFHFAFNTIGMVGFLYFSTRYFVSRIDVEKARANRLLLNVLPSAIADRLKRGEEVIADRHKEVTVLFTDIVGFTPFAAVLEAREVVLLLDQIFSAFDRIAFELGLEKIKTIGDAYMLVGGAPEAQADHADRVAKAALHIRGTLEQLARTRGMPLSMRIGMHSGEVVAGVIGKSKFTFDLWGDTVNTASRRESHGLPGRIHVSEATRQLLSGRYRFEERGVISVKGKGEMRTFWLEGPAEPQTL
jgi:adenylate cyclase